MTVAVNTQMFSKPKLWVVSSYLSGQENYDFSKLIRTLSWLCTLTCQEAGCKGTFTTIREICAIAIFKLSSSWERKGKGKMGGNRSGAA